MDGSDNLLTLIVWSERSDSAPKRVIFRGVAHTHVLHKYLLGFMGGVYEFVIKESVEQN